MVLAFGFNHVKRCAELSSHPKLQLGEQIVTMPSYKLEPLSEHTRFLGEAKGRSTDTAQILI